MKQDEIIVMARQVGLCRTHCGFNDWIDAGPSALELVEFAKLVAAKEREACAKLCESHGPTLANGAMLANAIRARGEA